MNKTAMNLGTTRRLAAAALAAPIALLALAGPAAARDELTLRVNDAHAPPAGLAAVVIRTYASKPISQGQVCFFARASRSRQRLAATADGGPFTAIEGVEVFARRGDGLSVAAMDSAAGEQMIVVEFSSASGTINQSDGPLAVVFLRVSGEVEPGERYEIEIDAANTRVVDAAGNPVPLEPRAGELRIRHPADPYQAEAEDDEIRPGRRAELGVETFEPVAMAGGRIGFTYDPAIARGRPKVKLDKKYGRRRFTADVGTPGLVLVTFRSRDASFNRVPGEIVSIRLRTSRNVAPGTRSPVAIDPSLTFFEAPDGSLLPYEFEGGSIRFTRGRDDDDDD